MIADGCLQVSLRTCRSNSVSFHFTQTFPKKVRVVSNHALLKSFVQRKNQSLPNVRLHAGSSTDRSMDLESANFKEPAATRRCLQHADHCTRCFLSTPKGQLQSQAASDSCRSLLSEWETKAVFNFCFQNLVAKNVQLVTLFRLVFGF